MANKDGEMIPFDGEMAISEFKDKAIRKVFQDGEWFFSISDVVGAVVETDRPSKYWSDLKHKLTKEGFNQLSEKIGQLKMPATAELTRTRDAQGFMENQQTAHAGGKIAGDARRNLETQLQRPVVSSSNFLPKRGDQGELPQGEA